MQIKFLSIKVYKRHLIIQNNNENTILVAKLKQNFLHFLFTRIQTFSYHQISVICWNFQNMSLFHRLSYRCRCFNSKPFFIDWNQEKVSVKFREYCDLKVICSIIHVILVLYFFEQAHVLLWWKSTFFFINAWHFCLISLFFKFNSAEK